MPAAHAWLPAHHPPRSPLQLPVIPSGVSRAFSFARSAGTRSRGISLRSPSRLVASKQRGAVFSFVGARYIVPAAHAWLPVHHPPHANGSLAPYGVRELAPAVCRRGLPRRAPRINLETPIAPIGAFSLADVPTVEEQGFLAQSEAEGSPATKRRRAAPSSALPLSQHVVVPHMLAAMSAIRSVLTGRAVAFVVRGLQPRVIPSKVAGRCFLAPLLRGVRPRSRGISLRSPMRLVASTQRAAVFSFVGARHVAPAALGYPPTIRLMRTGTSHHVECGGLLPPSAVGACPGVLLASTWKRQSPNWRVWFYVAHPASTE